MQNVIELGCKSQLKFSNHKKYVAKPTLLLRKMAFLG